MCVGQSFEHPSLLAVFLKLVLLLYSVLKKFALFMNLGFNI